MDGEAAKKRLWLPDMQKRLKRFVLPMKYWAFISYTSADEKAARRLHQFLESYSVPKQMAGKPSKNGDLVPQRLYPVFRDRDELGGSASLPQELKARLSDSRWLVVVCTHSTPAAYWVNQEVQYFIRVRGSQYVVCVFPDGVDKEGLSKQLPNALVKAENDPLGVDLSGRENESIARLRVVAALAGVEFSVLHDRDAKRKRRQLIIVSVLVATAVGGLLTLLNYQRNAREYAVYASALSSAGLPADPEDVTSLRESVGSATSPIVSWRGRRFLSSNEVLSHTSKLDDADYVLDTAANIVLVLSKDGGDMVSMLSFPSLENIIGQTQVADGISFEYSTPVVRLEPYRYAVRAQTQSSSAGGSSPALVVVDGIDRKINVYGLDDLGSDINVNSDCSLFAVFSFGKQKVINVNSAVIPSAQVSWISWDDLSDAKLHSCQSLLMMVRRDE